MFFKYSKTFDFLKIETKLKKRKKKVCLKPLKVFLAAAIGLTFDIGFFQNNLNFKQQKFVSFKAAYF